MTPRQPSLWDQPKPVRRKRGPFAPTSEDAGVAMPDDAKAHQRRKIMDTLVAFGPATYAELSERTGIKLCSVCWRMKELREMGATRVVTADGKIVKRGGGRLVEATYTPLKRAG